jgi:hypothetical protein
MERSRDHGDLAAALAEARPQPREAFATELDARVAAGFPRRSRWGGSPLTDIAERLRGLPPRRLLLAGGGTAFAAIAVATVIVAGSGGDQRRVALDSGGSQRHRVQSAPPAFERAGGLASSGSAATEGESSAALPSHSAATGQAAMEELLPESANANTALRPLSHRLHRDIERSAEIGLLAEPDDVAGDSAAVFTAVHDVDGVVLHSTTRAGRRAGARFDLLIPSAKLGDALAAFSAIDEVITRHEATDDITAPTVATNERLRDSRARIDGLLAQLANAETETEMEAVEAELAGEHRHAARLRAQLDRLEQRTDFSRVSVRIETGSSSTDSGGAWGIGDAFDDAAHVLGVAAGVTLVGLAVIAPFALLCLLAWLAHRFWLRSGRERALDA